MNDISIIEPLRQEKRLEGAAGVCVHVRGAPPRPRFGATLRPGETFLPSWEIGNARWVPSWTEEPHWFLTVDGPLHADREPDAWGLLFYRVREKPVTEPVWVPPKREVYVGWSPTVQRVSCRHCGRVEVTR